MIISRLLCAAYCLALTVLLLVPNPLGLLGIQRSLGPSDSRGIHFLLFTLMTLVASAARWPIRRATLFGVLVGYGILTETLQWYVPPRTVELLDYLENVLGVLTGTAIWSMVERQQSVRKAWQEGLPANTNRE